MEFCLAYGYHGQVSPVQDRPLQLGMEIHFIQGSLWWVGRNEAQWWLIACLVCDSISSRGSLLDISSLLLGFNFTQVPISSMTFIGM